MKMWLARSWVTDWSYLFVRSTLGCKLFLLTILGVIQGTMQYRVPEFNNSPSNITVHIGERAVLPCSVRHLGTKEVIWKKVNQSHALTVGKVVWTKDKSYDVDHLAHKEDWNLIISRVRSKHAGVYECQVSTKEEMSRFIHLHVLTSPSARKLKGPYINMTGKEFVEKGDPIILHCNATGEYRPPDEIDWFFNGDKLRAKEKLTITKYREVETKTLHSQLIIDHSKMADSGNYICRSTAQAKLLITSKNVMVLNAETNPNKRGTIPDDDGTAGQRGPGSSAVSHIHVHQQTALRTLILTLLLARVFSLHIQTH